MPRVEVYGIVDVSGVPQSGASVQVNIHGGAAASLFTTEAGGVAASNPMTTDSNGVFGATQSVWVAEGTYDFVVSGSGITTFTVTEDLVRGSNVPGSVLTTTGDIGYASAANTLARLAVGSTGQVLAVSGGVPAWASSGVPAGVVVPYAGSSAPTGWLLCDATSYLRTDYADLFTVIGTTYGSVDGTHFTVPDLRGRSVAGKGSNATVSTLGNNDGVTETNRRGTLHKTTGAYTSTVNNVALTGAQNGVVTNSTPAGTSTDPADGGAYLVLNHIIKT